MIKCSIGNNILFVVSFLTLMILNSEGIPQTLLNELIISEPIMRSNAILLDPEKSMLIVTSTIRDLKFESNMGENVKEKEAGIWHIELSPGPNIVTFKAQGFKTEKKAFTVQKNRAYNVEVIPKIIQRQQQPSQIIKPKARSQTEVRQNKTQTKLPNLQKETPKKEKHVPEMTLGTELFYDFSTFNNEIFYRKLKIKPYANYHDGVGGGVSLNFKYLGIGFKYSSLIINEFNEKALNYFGSSGQVYAKFTTPENKDMSFEAGIGYLQLNYKVRDDANSIADFKMSNLFCLFGISMGSPETRIFGETNLKFNSDGKIYNLYNRVGLRFYRNLTSSNLSNIGLKETRFRIFYDLNYRTSFFKEQFWKQQLGDLPKVKQNDCIGGGIGLGSEAFRVYFNTHVIYNRISNSINSTISGKGYQTYAQIRLIPNSFLSPEFGGGYYWFQYIVSNGSQSIVWKNKGPFGILGLSLGSQSFRLFGESDIVIKEGAVAIISLRSGVRISFSLNN